MNRTLKIVLAAVAIRQVRRTVKLRRNIRRVQRTLDQQSAQQEASLRADAIRNYTSVVQRAWKRVDVAIAATHTTPDDRAAAASLDQAERAALSDVLSSKWNVAQRELSGFATRVASLTPPAQFVGAHRDLVASIAEMSRALDAMIAGMSDVNGTVVRNAGAQFAAAGDSVSKAVAKMTRNI